MKQIILTQKKITLVDDDQYEFLNQWKWFALKDKNTFYVARSAKVEEYKKGKRFHIYMHHVVIGFPPKGFVIDHRNGNGLWNLKSNLRFVTFRQNCQNLKNINKSSQYPGIYWDKKNKKWMARIKINGIIKYLGRFTDELKAFTAYKQAVECLGQTVIGNY